MLRKIIVTSLLVLWTLGGASLLWAGDGGTLTPGEAIQGQIAERDEQDVYTFEGTSGDAIVLTVTASEDSSLDTVLELYDPAGELLDTNDDTPFVDGSTNSELRLTLREDGEYRVVVLAFAGVSVGDYEILLANAEDVAPLPEVEEPQDLVLELGAAMRGNLELGESDSWRFVAPDDVFVRITVFSSEFDSTVELYDEDGILLERDDDSGGGFNASIVGVQLTGGVAYEIRASSFLNNGAGRYVITLDLTAAPPEPAAMAYGDTLDSEVITGQATQFIFEGQQDDVVSISVEGNFDSYLLLLDDAGILLDEDDDSGGDLQPLVNNLVLPRDGSYTIEITGYSNFDSGEFSITLTLLDVTVTTDGGLLESGQTVSGIANGNNPPNYTIEGSAGDQISISVEADFDGVMELYSPSGELIASDDDSGAGLNPRFTLITLPEDGDYRLVLGTYSPGDSGAYSLTLLAGDEGAQTIALNSSEEGFLEPGGISVFVFEASAGDVVSARVSSDFDPLLELRNTSGEILARDDDSGGSLQPALTEIPLTDSGQYVLVVTGFGFQDGGPFTLTLDLGSVVSAPPPGVEGLPIAYGDILPGALEGGTVQIYTFSGQQGDVISVAIDSEFDGIMDIYGPSGTLVATDDDSGFDLNPLIEDLSLPNDGAYRIEVGTFSGSAGGSFEIALILEQSGEGGGTPSDDTLVVYGASNDSELTDTTTEFTFNANAGDVVTISVEANFDALIEVYNSDGDLIAGDDDSGDGLNPLVEDLTLDAAGTYTISVTSFDGQGRGPFTLFLDADEGDTGEVAAQVIQPGERVRSTLEISSSNTYVFNAAAGDVVSLSATTIDPASSLDLYLELYGPSGDLLLADDDSGWLFNPAMTGIELSEEGTYRVEVQSFAGASSGEYALAMESGAVHIAPSGEVAQALPSDGGTATVPVELNAGSSQAYVFTITEGDSLTVTTTAPELVIDIYSPSGLDIPLASGDPLLVPASDTFVMVIYARADTAGELTVNLGETVQEVVVVEQGEVAPDVSVRGTLAANEVQTYTFIPVLNGDYTVSLTSEDADKRYDPYLIVRNAAGEVIGSDDDSGGEFNALLEGLTLVGGEAITVEVHSFADQSSGNYLLVVVTDHVEQPPLIEGGELTLDESASHTLELPGQQAEFTFTVAEAGLFNATLEGLKLPIVDIFDEENTLVARGTGSIKDQMLEAGTYRVVVYDRLNRPGDFTLTMEVAEQ